MHMSRKPRQTALNHVNALTKPRNGHSTTPSERVAAERATAERATPRNGTHKRIEFPETAESLPRILLHRSLAVVLLVPGLPLMVLLGVLVRLTSRGPAIYRQTRVGKHGKPFELYKLRSMVRDAEKDGPKWAAQKDSRVTLLGRLLRKFHLDELPQLFNVLKGEMALVGPRPERPEFVEELRKKIPDYMRRLEVLPGITGLAQLNLPPDTNLESVRRKLVLDLEYIRSAGIWMDLSIILCTSCRLVKFSERLLLPAFGLKREPEFDDTVFVHIADTKKHLSEKERSFLLSLPEGTIHADSSEYPSGGAKY